MIRYPQLKVKAVCGSANNQLKDEDAHSKMLEDKGILYAPDYIVNSGGVINTADELNGYNEDRAKESIEGIDQILKHIFDISKEQNETPLEASQHFAEKEWNKCLIFMTLENKLNKSINKYKATLI